MNKNRRSDDIRQRRKSTVANPKLANKKRADRVVSYKPPPVMVRKPLAGISQPVVKKNKKTRKFYRFSLDPTYGTEMRLPSLPGVRLSWRLVSLMLVALLGGALYFLWESPSFRIDAPKIDGLKRINSNQVNSELNLLGQPIFLLDAIKLEQDLLREFPEFSDVSVQIQFPNKIGIQVTERIPVLVWMNEGESVLVDAEGMTFPDRGADPPGSYPVVEASGDPVAVDLPTPGGIDIRDATIRKITGVLLPSLSVEDEVKPLLSPEMVSSILVVAEQSPEGSKLLYDPVHGLGWTDRRGWNVYLGDAEDMEIKVQIYRAIMENLKKDETRPSYISVEYAHAPYYRIED